VVHGDRRQRPRRAAGLASVLAAAALAAALACERQEVAGELAARRDAAARRGIAWLLANRGAMQPEWAFALFSYLPPIAPDDAVARTCRQVLDEVSTAPFAELPPTLDDPELLRVGPLQSLAAELVRRRWRSEPWQEPARALEALLHRHAEAVTDRTPLTQRAILLHGFEVVGIEAPWTLDDVVREIRARWSREERAALVEDTGFMFALTHVFYTASGYFTRRPDPAAFGPEREMLRAALGRYLSAPVPPSRFFLDIQAEVVVSLRLLGEPEDDDLRAMAERLLALQSPDGSWGEPQANHRFHATIVAVQALLDWPDPFRRP
jgi:hypothetical protein